MDCSKLLDEATFLELSHTLREENKCADFLANWGDISNWGTIILERSPEDS